MQWGLVLFAKLFRGKNKEQTYRQIRSLGFTPALLPLTQQTPWKWVESAVLQDGSVPTERMFLTNFPGIQFPPTEEFVDSVEQDSVREVIAQLQKKRSSVLGIEASEKLAHAALADPDQVLDIVNQTRSKLVGTIPLPGAIDVGHDVETDMLEYAQFSKPDGAGLPFPISAFVPGGMGLNREGLYFFYGAPGSKKTFWLFYLALWYARQGQRVLLLSQEWLWARAKWRLYCLQGEFSWPDVQDGRVDPARMRETINWFTDHPNILYQNPLHVADPRAPFEALVSKFEPDVVLDDSPYLRTMPIGKDVVTIRNSTHAASDWFVFAKNLCTGYGLAYMCTWQPNDEGEMYGTRAARQDAEMVLFLDSDLETTQLKTKKQRDGAFVPQVTIHSNLLDTVSFGRVVDDFVQRQRIHTPKARPKISLRANAKTSHSGDEST